VGRPSAIRGTLDHLGSRCFRILQFFLWRSELCKLVSKLTRLILYDTLTEAVSPADGEAVSPVPARSSLRSLQQIVSKFQWFLRLKKDIHDDPCIICTI